MATPTLAPVVGALADAWAELRTHKLRVLLSLIGIAVSVGALTAVVAIGEYQKQSMAEQSDRYGGRIATLAIGASTTDGSPVDWDDLDERFARVNERYGFTYTTRVVQGLTLPAQLPAGVTEIPTRLLEPAFPIIHREKLAHGRWFTPGDAELLAPAIVVSEPLWEMLGSQDLATHPTLVLTGDLAGTYQIVGVTPKQGIWDTEPRIDLSYGTYRDRVDALPKDAMVTREVWVPPDIVNELGPVLAMDLRAGLPESTEISVNRTDWGAQSGYEESARMFQIITGSIAGLVLLLGALSLVNIQLVAMRQRIREIGVRRSFGATGGRIFTSVLLESLVATTLAGVVGIALAVAVLRGGWLIEMMFPGIQDVPPFPFGAALIGLIAAVAVGALAGVIPALVALRVRVIDAIRF
jgi:putative ABC transport system permease protein